jgi:uncharacterized protein (TIGR00369 family)
MTAEPLGARRNATVIDEEHFRKLERMYSRAPCNEYYSPRLTISKGATVLVIAVQEKYYHSVGAVHGSVYFKALDDAGFFAVNSLVDDVFVLTASFYVNLFRPVESGEMKALGKVVMESKNLFVAEARLMDSQDREIARGIGTYARGKAKLTPEIGYE